MTLGIVNYGRGNLHSVANACKDLGAEAELVSTAAEIEACTHLIFPGQGSFGECVRNLDELGLRQPLLDFIAADRPFFGICVGFQLLFESSEESPEASGLGVFPGKVTRFRSETEKIPHMGWNETTLRQPESTAWQGLGEKPFFYYVHSFCPKDTNHPAVAATCHYAGEDFCAAVTKGNLVAAQFHPEKSQHAGLQLLQNFLAT